MKKPVITFENFGFQYNAQAEPTLYDINLTIYEGEKVLVAGPSGSGKSTLAHCINGLIPFSYPGESTGRLTILDKVAKEQSIFELSKLVGTVLQDPDGQFIGLTVGEDIAFALENDCMPHDELVERTAEVAKLVDIHNHLAYAPHELSGGQKQRVSLAGVMVDNVEILLFDEPLANLDPATGKQTIDLIDRIQKKTNTTIVIIEHRLEDVLYRDIDRVILMNEGRIVADLHPDELLSGNLLIESGIREPLYITALKYTGCTITPDMKAGHIDTIRLDESCVDKVQQWFRSTPPAVPEKLGEPLLEVEHVSFGYTEQHQILHDNSFCVHKGEMVSIVGRNGAGKSTMSKLICGFEKQNKGRILLGGKDLAGDTIKERAQHIGYVMQNPNQMISKNMIFDEVAMGLASQNLPPEEIARRVEETLKICGLHQFRKWPISALSFGQKKRVTIASVLVMSPEIIILDEPTAGQDFRHYTEIMEFLRTLNAQGVTVIMITHDMHLMQEYTPRAIVFADGEIVADDTAAAVLTSPQIIEQASLKETSLFTLAERCGIAEPREFVQRFIDYDRQVRG
ncbi:ABC transporter ATP-binding protein [Hydrogenoanaerobacterium sp.]|uniref:ABC transporter ATP-binding protein n=1 Tax=Hydrogenoanaerobacterium sp. TaxID=2953763 RepID=UPI00289AC1F5|nr:ABC transporter ATP-binding protein [Hydrogenoanaerobacterium sp.]